MSSRAFVFVTETKETWVRLGLGGERRKAVDGPQLSGRWCPSSRERMKTAGRCLLWEGEGKVRGQGRGWASGRGLVDVAKV